MSHERRRQFKDVVLRIGDRKKTIHGVTEQATFGDVIRMIRHEMNKTAQNIYSYAIFESGNCSEQMLSDKAKVLKTMRSWGLDNSHHFRLRPVRNGDKIFKTINSKSRKTAEEARKADEVHETRKAYAETNNANVAHMMEKTANLAQFVHSQKTRLNMRKTNNCMSEMYCEDGDTSIDRFIETVDQSKMVGFLDICGKVTANELVRLSKISECSKQNGSVCANGFINSKQIRNMDKINDIRYANKKCLREKQVSYERQSKETDRKQMPVRCDSRSSPCHSTPKCSRSDTKPIFRGHQDLAEDITSKIERINQREAKDIILNRYFADYLSYNSPHSQSGPLPKRESGDGAETSLAQDNSDKGDESVFIDTPVHINGAHARRYSDSDSGHEDRSHLDNLDDAFLSSARKAADNKLRHVHDKLLPRKLVSYDVTLAPKVDKLVDYSSSDDSLIESDENTIEMFERNVFDEDDEMASFVDSKLHDDFSDEGLSSLESDDEKEVMV